MQSKKDILQKIQLLLTNAFISCNPRSIWKVFVLGNKFVAKQEWCNDESDKVPNDSKQSN